MVGALRRRRQVSRLRYTRGPYLAVGHCPCAQPARAAIIDIAREHVSSYCTVPHCTIMQVVALTWLPMTTARNGLLYVQPRRRCTACCLAFSRSVAWTPAAFNTYARLAAARIGQACIVRGRLDLPPERGADRAAQDHDALCGAVE